MSLETDYVIVLGSNRLQTTDHNRDIEQYETQLHSVCLRPTPVPQLLRALGVAASPHPSYLSRVLPFKEGGPDPRLL